MPNVSDVLRVKGDQVATVTADSTVLDAARLMNDRRIGSVVVVEGDRPIGIFTERDVLTRVVAAERSAATTRIHEVMTVGIMTCSPNADLDILRALMREKHVRHIPVVHDGRLCGMISIGDLNQVEVRVLVESLHYLEQYSVRT